MWTGATRWQPRCLNSAARLVIRAATQRQRDPGLDEGSATPIAAGRSRSCAGAPGSHARRGRAAHGRAEVRQALAIVPFGAVRRAADLELDQGRRGGAWRGRRCGLLARRRRPSPPRPARVAPAGEAEVALVGAAPAFRAAPSARRRSGRRRRRSRRRSICAAPSVPSAQRRDLRRGGAGCERLGGRAGDATARVASLAAAGPGRTRGRGRGRAAMRRHLLGLVGEDEADPCAAAAGPAGATDPVHVGVAVPGSVEVDDVGDAVDVDAAGRDVGRDQGRRPRRARSGPAPVRAGPGSCRRALRPPRPRGCAGA